MLNSARRTIVPWICSHQKEEDLLGILIMLSATLLSIARVGPLQGSLRSDNEGALRMALHIKRS